jgi:hypothetical protein
VPWLCIYRRIFVTKFGVPGYGWNTDDSMMG